MPLDPSARERPDVLLHGALRPTERVLWRGHGEPSLSDPRRFGRLTIGAVLTSLGLASGRLAATGNPLYLAAAAPLLGVGIMQMGLALLDHFHAQRALYAVTSERVFVITLTRRAAWDVYAVERSALGKLRVTRSADGRADIAFADDARARFSKLPASKEAETALAQLVTGTVPRPRSRP